MHVRVHHGLPSRRSDVDADVHARRRKLVRDVVVYGPHQLPEFVVLVRVEANTLGT
jgi:hypothetical protein